VLAPYFVRAARGMLLVIGAGAADALAAFVAKLIVDELSHGRWVGAVGLGLTHELLEPLERLPVEGIARRLLVERQPRDAGGGGGERDGGRVGHSAREDTCAGLRYS